jgi:hypothetical protein
MRLYATSLDLHRSEQQPANDFLRVIGMARGNEQRQMLCLRVGGQLTVVAGNKSKPLTELIEFDAGKFSIDTGAIRQLIDSVATGAYTPSIDRREERKLETQAMYEDWRKAYRELKKQRRNMSDVWYSRQNCEAGDRRGSRCRNHQKAHEEINK